MNPSVSRRTLLRSALSVYIAAPHLQAQETTEGPITPTPRSRSAPDSTAAPAPRPIAPSVTSSGATTPNNDPTFSSNVRVVNVFATVRDQSGKIVKELNRQDFTLAEDGRPQTIGYFERESNLPLTIGFLLDTSGSTRQVLPDEKSAARHFIDKVLREKQDQAFVIHFDREVELLQDVTPLHPKLEQALDEVQSSPRWGPSPDSGSGSGNGGGGGWPGRGGGRGRGGGVQSHGGGTLFFDAVMLASKEVMRRQTGRKALIVLSDGGDRGSKTTMIAAVESAQRSDTLIYSVFFKGQEPGGFERYGGRGRYGGGTDTGEIDVGRNAMRWMAHQTGGSFFIVTEDRPVDRVLAQIEEELRSQYSLGYTSDNMSTSKEFRRITVDTRRPELVVRARTGYYPG